MSTRRSSFRSYPAILPIISTCLSKKSGDQQGTYFDFCPEDFTRQAWSSNKWLPAWCARLKTRLALKSKRSFELTSFGREPCNRAEIALWNPYRLPNSLERGISLKGKKRRRCDRKMRKTAHLSRAASQKFIKMWGTAICQKCSFLWIRKPTKKTCMTINKEFLTGQGTTIRILKVKNEKKL